MPFKYGKTKGERKERINETVTIVSVAGQPTRRDGIYEYLNFVLDTKVKKTIKGEIREVADKITTFPEVQGGELDWEKDMPSVIKELDKANERGSKKVKVKVVYYLSKDNDKRATLGDLAKWQIVG